MHGAHDNFNACCRPSSARGRGSVTNSTRRIITPHARSGCPALAALMKPPHHFICKSPSVDLAPPHLGKSRQSSDFDCTELSEHTTLDEFLYVCSGKEVQPLQVRPLRPHSFLTPAIVTSQFTCRTVDARSVVLALCHPTAENSGHGYGSSAEVAHSIMRAVTKAKTDSHKSR